MHPLQTDISGLSDNELDERIKELTKKYFQAIRLSPSAAEQIIMMLEDYKHEYQNRLERKRTDMERSMGTNLDDLINIG
jgi:flagellar biosynthesis chaperone FliJ